MKELSKFIEAIVKIGPRASKIHEDVNQTYDGKPYYVHLNNVVAEVMAYAEDEIPDEDIPVIVFGAFFHDAIEDARLTYNDVIKIAKEYMPEDKAYLATEIVYALTNEKGKNRAERANDKYYLGIRSTQYASFIKMADRLANLKYAISSESRMVSAYRKELDHFIESIVVDVEYPDLNYFCGYVPSKMIEDIKKL